MTNEMMNVEKIIKGAERMILRSMSTIDTKQDNDGLTVSECNLRIAVATAIINEASKSNPSQIAIENMKLALDNLMEMSSGTYDGSPYDGCSSLLPRDYCCAILYLNGRIKYSEQAIRKFAFNKIPDKERKEFDAKVDITLKAMNLFKVVSTRING